MLVVEIDKKGHVKRYPDYEKTWKRLVTTLLELILIKKVSMNMKNLVEYKSTLMN